jgi:hypothetical protein
MTRKKVLAAVAALVVGLAFAAAHAPAAVKGCSPLKNGTKGCKNEIKECITARVATGERKKKAKVACTKDTVTACKANTAACASPSGAFLDDLL